MKEYSSDQSRIQCLDVFIYVYEYVCVCEYPYVCENTHTPFLRVGDGMDEWLKALTSCEAIGAVPGSNLQNVRFIY